MKIDLAAVSRSAPGRVHAGPLPSAAFVATDTRTLRPGDAFLALRGERFDGHHFTPEAIARGAAALVVDDAVSAPPGVPVWHVPDTLAAYLACARAARQRLSVPVLAITGSTGKTTTKAFVQQLLESAGFAPVAATPANENNEIGVAKLLLGIDLEIHAPRAVVVEMGARHYGDIATLTQAALPSAGILTNVGDAHVEIMGSPERLAETKWGLFASGAVALLNADDAVSLARASTLARRPRWFAARAAGDARPLPAGDVVAVVGRTQLSVRRGDVMTVHAIDARFAGEHNLANLAAALAGALHLGAEPDALVRAVPDLALPDGRYARRRAGEVDVIFDAYNASYSGTLATLQSFAREAPGGRRIAVLGSMAELGDDAEGMHERVGAAAAAAGLGALLVGGDFAEALERGARGAGFSHVLRFARNAEAAAWLRDHAREGDLVLLKASRKYRLEEILDGLSAHA